jgi:hypothetical protein
MKATVSTILQEMKSWREETKACLEKWESIGEVVEVMKELWEAPNKEECQGIGGPI